MSVKGQDRKRAVVIRKEEVVQGGHHGGAWKVAYADFVTAMMAFFLLMWLLNATTQEQKRGLADYFSPNNLTSRTNSGFGAPFGGLTPNLDGSLASDRGSVQLLLAPTHPNIDTEDDQGDVPAQTSPEQLRGTAARPLAREGGAAPAKPHADSAAKDFGARDSAAKDSAAEKAIQEEIAKRERQQFEAAAQKIRDAIRADPALADLAKQLAIDITPEGLRIQLLDEDRSPMFSTGSAALNDRARAVLAKVAPVLVRLPESVAIAGYTDAAPYRGGERSNWDLSSERANATRRLLTDAGLPEARIRTVAGHADREPLIPADPMAAANRRIAIVVLRTQAAPAR